MIPGRGTKIPHPTWHGQKKKKKILLIDALSKPPPELLEKQGDLPAGGGVEVVKGGPLWPPSPKQPLKRRTG